MDIDVAAAFLVGSILFGLGFIVFGIVIVVLNNIFHKYWKKFEFFIWNQSEQSNLHFVSQEELEMIERQRAANNETKIS